MKILSTKKIEIAKEDLRPLPNGWVWTTLGEATNPIQKRVNPHTYPDLPYIGMENIEPHTMRLLGTVPAREMRSTADSFSSGDVLYGRLRPYLNKVYRPDFKGLCSTEFIIFRKVPHTESKYLQYFLNSWDFVQFANRLNAGDRPRVKFEQLADYPFPLPPLPEQERIVSRLEELLSDLEAGVEALERVCAGLKRYKASVLKAACEGKLFDNREIGDGELPEGWRWATVKELGDGSKYALKAGPFGSSLKKEFYVPKGYKIYGQEQVIRGDPYFGDYYIDEDRYQQLKSNAVKPGDILISLVGTIGKVLILPKKIEPGIINPRLVKLSLNRKLIDSRYFKLFMETVTARHYFSTVSHGETMEILNLNILKTLLIPLPTLMEQQNIVAEVERRLESVWAIEVAVDVGLKRAGRLRHSVLKAAFEGKLS
jgi:type I restriction enzyme S subunit